MFLRWCFLVFHGVLGHCFFPISFSGFNFIISPWLGFDTCCVQSSIRFLTSVHFHLWRLSVISTGGGLLSFLVFVYFLGFNFSVLPSYVLTRNGTDSNVTSRGRSSCRRNTCRGEPIFLCDRYHDMDGYRDQATALKHCLDIAYWPRQWNTRLVISRLGWWRV